MEQKKEEVSYWIERLGMQPHPEGGYYSEVYRSEWWIPVEEMPAPRRVLTTIYYLLEGKAFSAFHRIKSPESWFFHKGMPLLIYSFEEEKLICRELSDREEGSLQVTIEPGIWFAARLKGQKGFTLVSCAVAPGFEFEDFELADRKDLLDEYPEHKAEILGLTRPE
jgi:hypothetical protein